MTESEIEKIIERDMPGWHLAKRTRLPAAREKSFMVAVENDAGIRKTVVISGGRIIGAAG